MFFSRHKTKMVMPTEALPGREQPAFTVPERHAVLGTSLKPPFPEGMSTAVFGLGCFWGAERKFWQIDGVYTTAVGYAGGFTPNPTYEEVCSGRTGHNEVVLVAFRPDEIAGQATAKFGKPRFLRRRRPGSGRTPPAGLTHPAPPAAAAGRCRHAAAAP